MTAPPSTSRSRRPRGWGRALSARRVSHVVAIDQCWADHLGKTVPWRVAQIHRKDGTVRLEFAFESGYVAHRYVSFSELGKGYRLLEGEVRVD